mmetsp:Transcript_3764/g.11825  ORF Transcript_3764/g.11825 Transcript_3764/m.11825 type:complete len:212 (+) Transcript_3764:334-969(+)
MSPRKASSPVVSLPPRFTATWSLSPPPPPPPVLPSSLISGDEVGTAVMGGGGGGKSGKASSPLSDSASPTAGGGGRSEGGGKIASKTGSWSSTASLISGGGGRSIGGSIVAAAMVTSSATPPPNPSPPLDAPSARIGCGGYPLTAGLGGTTGASSSGTPGSRFGEGLSGGRLSGPAPPSCAAAGPGGVGDTDIRPARSTPCRSSCRITALI